MAPSVSSVLTVPAPTEEFDPDEVVARVRNVRRSFGGPAVLDGVDLELRRGEVIALVGRSGSGKSTLLRVLAGLDSEHQGEVQVIGRRAVAFQEPRLLPWKRVLDNVALGAGGDARVRGQDALTEVGLAHRADAWPLTLSGGEAQRASLARALVRSPDLLLLDEPFGALDALTRLTAQRLLQTLHAAHGFAVLLVTHDVEEAVLLADRVVVLDAGRLAVELPVQLPRPRSRTAPAVLALRDRVLTALGVPADEATPSTTQES